MQINTFIEKCSKHVGEAKKNSFAYEVNSTLADNRSDSPIEKIFYAAFSTLLELNDLSFREFYLERYVQIRTGIDCLPQYPVGKYRVDFAMWSFGSAQLLVERPSFQVASEKPVKQLAVELDGHAFHDRDAAQRSYEKRRDRFLQKQGYEVFHYTGADVCANPFKVALECLAYLTGEPEDCFKCPKFGE